LVLDLGRERARDALVDHDGPPAERGESGDHLLDVGPVPRHGDARGLRLGGLRGVRREIGVDRHRGVAHAGRSDTGGLAAAGRGGLARVKSCTSTAPRRSITTSTRPGAGSTLTALTSPSRPGAPPIRGLTPGPCEGAAAAASSHAARAAMGFMAIPPAWRATVFPGARSRI